MAGALRAGRPAGGYPLIRLFPLSALDATGCKEAVLERDGRKVSIFAVRREAEVFAYANSCPHRDMPLNWQPDTFLSIDRSALVCSVHGALFDITTGGCFRGPCLGRALEAVPVAVIDGWVCAEE